MAAKRLCGLALLALLCGPAAAPAPAQDPLPGPSCTPPTISGEARDGQVLTGRAGSCTPLASLSVSLRWWRCKAQQCIAVSPGRSSPSRYTLTPDDVGRRIELRQTAVVGLAANITTASTAEVAALPPESLAPPEITGALAPGQTLRASLGFWAGTPPLRFEYRWQRCARRCTDIPRATESGYFVRTADQGRRLRVVVVARNAAESDVSAASARTEPVGGASAPRRLRPFPTVVVAGQALGDGAQVSELSVRGPRGAKVEVRCRGGTCPFKRLRRELGSRALHIRALERKLRPGTVIDIRVTEPGRLGKFTRIAIRRGRVPKRIDRCLAPGSRKPTRCPL